MFKYIIKGFEEMMNSIEKGFNETMNVSYPEVERNLSSLLITTWAYDKTFDRRRSLRKLGLFLFSILS